MFRPRFGFPNPPQSGKLSDRYHHIVERELSRSSYVGEGKVRKSRKASRLEKDRGRLTVEVIVVQDRTDHSPFAERFRLRVHGRTGLIEGGSAKDHICGICR